MADQKTHEKRAQDAERAMREERERQNKIDWPKPKGEPRFRSGADRSGLGRKGFSEVEGREEPPKRRG